MSRILIAEDDAHTLRSSRRTTVHDYASTGEFDLALPPRQVSHVGKGFEVLGHGTLATWHIGG
ncbi:hypothetical protein JOD67_006777 [Tenggerimyces flavus]|nr:hypothetical protein [Tenggerimyces flavus]